MTTLLIYDVPDDALRYRVAEACLDYGLRRVQYSAFVGELSRNRQQEILLRIRRLLGSRPARVQLVPVCEKDLRLMKEVVTAGYVIAS
ncbi:MAG TPA: CRISPR-associated endonuclease Cas2 [Dehalococcoidia bacterium]|nr:CRISPR-associated endonuclease Cas2 [Dehalococcoidia bacterium]